MKAILLAIVFFLGDAQYNIVSIVEGVIIGMANDQADLSQCASDPSGVVSNFQNAISYLR